MDAGLSEINYSTGDEHTRFVPIERVAYAVVAACERELPVHVMVELKRGSTVTRDRLLRHEVLDGLTDRQRAALSVKTSPWMPLSPYRFHDYDAGVTANEETSRHTADAPASCRRTPCRPTAGSARAAGSACAPSPS
nr:hypothetical protein GCM10020093_080460 [Planobispora longispora]